METQTSLTLLLEFYISILFIICLDYIIRTSTDTIRENGFTLKKARSRWYHAETIMDPDYSDDIALLANTPTQSKSLLDSLEQAIRSIGLYVNVNKMEYMCFNQEGAISILNGTPLKLVDKFTYHSSSISSVENYVNIQQTKVWTAIDRQSIIWKSDPSNKIKQDFFQTAVLSILLYGCTTWMMTKCIEKNLDRNCTRMLQVILKKSRKQHPTKQWLYGH